MALTANPNVAHFALAELARRKGSDGGFRTLTQNVDGGLHLLYRGWKLMGRYRRLICACESSTGNYRLFTWASIRR